MFARIIERALAIKAERERRSGRRRLRDRHRRPQPRRRRARQAAGATPHAAPGRRTTTGREAPRHAAHGPASPRERGHAPAAKQSPVQPALRAAAWPARSTPRTRAAGDRAARSRWSRAALDHLAVARHVAERERLLVLRLRSAPSTACGGRAVLAITTSTGRPIASDDAAHRVGGGEAAHAAPFGQQVRDQDDRPAHVARALRGRRCTRNGGIRLV